MSEPRSHSVEEALSCGAPGARRNLMLSALKLFSEQGFDKTKTRDISAGAGFSTGAMYVHFDSKEAVLFEITLVGHQAVNALVEEIRAQGGSPTERVSSFVERFTTWHAENAMTARVIYREWPLLSPENRHEIVLLRRAFEDHVTALLDEGYAAGEFDAPDRDAALLAILSMGIDVCRWYAESPRADIQSLSKGYGQLVMRMLGASD